MTIFGRSGRGEGYAFPEKNIFCLCSSALRALRHKGRGAGVDGKEASMACSFLLAPLICSPEESRGSEATVYAIREQSQRP